MCRALAGEGPGLGFSCSGPTGTHSRPWVGGPPGTLAAGHLAERAGEAASPDLLRSGAVGKTGAPGTALSFVQYAACTSCWYFSWSLFQAELQFSQDNDALFSNNSLTLLCSSIDQGACRPVSGLLGSNSRALLQGLVGPGPRMWWGVASCCGHYVVKALWDGPTCGECRVSLGCWCSQVRHGALPAGVPQWAPDHFCQQGFLCKSDLATPERMWGLQGGCHQQ